MKTFRKISHIAALTSRLQGASTFAQFSSEAPKKETIDFGHREVPIAQKEELVGEVFHSVANQYDLMNDLMSAGIHRVWKNEFVSSLGLLKPRNVYSEKEIGKVERVEPVKVLDMAGGTGDIAFRILEQAKQNASSGYDQHPVHVTIMDINSSMLSVGKDRATERGFSSDQLDFVEGSAEELPFEDNTFDVYTISFGIRNVTHRDRALKEAHRVLKKGGRFMCLEFSKVQNPVFSQFYDFYNGNIVPLIGQVVAGDRDSYQYLVESIQKFPSQNEFKQLISDAGFKAVEASNMTDGIVAIHSGFKL